MPALVIVSGSGLHDDQPPAVHQIPDPPQEPSRVAADADVPVNEQCGSPAALVGQRLEHRTAQCLAASAHGGDDGGRTHIDPEHGTTPPCQLFDQPPGPAAMSSPRPVHRRSTA
ncbi:hypothetical protein J7E89_36770 [Streptomyces sp. ISL-100]|nr:hypothetical protein [Streptomyces sp. ISL-100]MBT2401345.1 hypothetical protein [Streptomyces sp. ISL-100]